MKIVITEIIIKTSTLCESQRFVSERFQISVLRRIKLYGWERITSRICPTRSRLIKRDTVHGRANLRNCHFLERGAVHRQATCVCNLIRRQYGRAISPYQPDQTIAKYSIAI